MNILIADNDKALLSQYAQWSCWSTLFNCKLATASNTAMALKLLRMRHFDLLITEISPPELDGVCLLKQASEEQLAGGVIFLSQHATFASAQKGIQYHLFDYLKKPITEKRLQDVIKKAAEYYGFSYTQPQNNTLVQNTIIHSLIRGYEDSVILFRKEITKISDPRKFYTNIISAVFQNLSWIENYVDVRSFYLEFTDTDAYTKIISGLAALLHVLLPLPDDCTIYKICSYVLKNIQQKIDSKSIANEFFFNYYYLSNMFKTKTGINLQQYIKTVRMIRAYHLVRYSNTHIYEIGGDLGFQNGEHFSSQFRKIIGVTPSALRSGNCDEIVPMCLQAGWSA